MKQNLMICVICLICIVGIASPVVAETSSKAVVSASEPDIQVYLNGMKIHFNVPAFINGGVTMVEFRPLFEAFGLDIHYDPITTQIIGSRSNWQLSLQPESNEAVVNGQTMKLDLAPKILNGHTVVPLRFIGEATGREVIWDQATRTIQINSTMISKLQDILSVGENDLKYVGTLNGKSWSGTGKLYYRGKLCYEGEFLDGNLNGKGTLYEPNSDNIQYQGDFIASKMQGNGLLFDSKGHKKYEGNWKNGHQDGEGQLFDDNGNLTFKGNFLNGQIEGEGKSYDLIGHVLYEGEYKNGLRSGKGTLHMLNGGTYIGDFAKGTFDGIGVYQGSSGNIIQQGQFRQGYFVDQYGLTDISYVFETVDLETSVNYSEGYQFSWKTNDGLGPEIYSDKVNFKAVFNGQRPGPTEPSLLNVLVISEAQYKTNYTRFTRLSQSGDKVIVYSISSNPIATDVNHKELYTTYERIIGKMQGIVNSFEWLDGH